MCMDEIRKLLLEPYKHFDFQFTKSEYDYFMENARFTKIEREVLELKRMEYTSVAIGLELGLSESAVNKIIKRIKNKIVKCIVLR